MLRAAEDIPNVRTPAALKRCAARGGHPAGSSVAAVTDASVNSYEAMPPILVLLAESDHAYRIVHTLAGALEDMVGGAGDIEVVGPFGYNITERYTWLGSDTPRSGEALLWNVAPEELTAEAMIAVDAYWNWHEANDH